MWFVIYLVIILLTIKANQIFRIQIVKYFSINLRQ